MIRRLIDRLLGRPRKPRFVPVVLTPERDWTVGDVAECTVDRGNWRDWQTGETTPGPRRAEHHRVTRVFANELTVWLIFSAWPGVAFAAGCFRKLRPCDPDFAATARRASPEPVRIDGAPRPVLEPVE